MVITEVPIFLKGEEAFAREEILMQLHYVGEIYSSLDKKSRDDSSYLQGECRKHYLYGRLTDLGKEMLAMMHGTETGNLRGVMYDF